MGSLAICTVRVQHVVMHGIKEKCTQGLGAEIQRQDFEDLDIDVRINTTYILNKGLGWGGHGLNSSGSEYIQMAGHCEHNETCRFHKNREIS